MMDLESYFDILAPDDIRIKGTRIGIESILYEYIHRGQSAEEIAAHFPALDLEQIYATILYYLHNKEEVHQYMTDWIEYGERMRREQEENPPPVVLRLRKLRQLYGDDAVRVVRERGLEAALAEPRVEYTTE